MDGGTNQTDQGFFYSGEKANQKDIYSVDAATAQQNFDDGFLYAKKNDLDPYSSEDGAGS